MESDQISRRRVLVGAAGSALVVFVDRARVAGAAGGTDARVEAVTGRGRSPQTGRAVAAFANPPTRTIHLVRSSDQLDVTIELFDVSVSASGDDIEVAGAQPAIRLTFGSQHTVERMFPGASPSVPTTAINHIAAGDSVVVIPVPDTVPFTLTQILTLAETALTVQTTAATPDGSVTALEVPASLAISPVAGTTLTAARTPFTVGNTTEIWLAKFRGVGTDPVRGAVVANLAPADLVTRIPDTVDRDRLVQNTTGGQVGDAPFDAKRLWLSSHGAFARIQGSWPSATLTRWKHRIAAGRDLHVEITTVGYLAPFGHRAAITEIADRVFINDTGGGQTSIMRLQRFLTLMEEEGIFYANSTPRPFQKHAGRGFPFKTVKASVDETIPISLTPVNDLSSNPMANVSDVKIVATGADMMVSYVAFDRDGNKVKFELPATFIDDDVAYNISPAAQPGKFIDVFNDAARNSRREVDLQGAGVAFADPLAPGTGSTTKKTYFMRFKLEAPEGATHDDLETALQPAFNPALAKAEVTDDLIGATTGMPGDAFEVTLHDRWLEDANAPANFDLAFLKLKDPKSGVIGGAGQPVTSVAAVELVAEVFNQSSGVGPDIEEADDPWDPSTALGAGSKLFGSLLLNQLLNTIPSNLAVPGVDIPGTEVTVNGDTVTVVFSFMPKLKTNELLGFIAHPNTRGNVVVTTVASLTGATPAVVTTEMAVTDFTMVFPPGGLVGIVEIDFAMVTALAPSNGSLTVDPKMTGWRLGDDLSFLQPIFDILESLGGLKINLSGDYLHLDAAINLPEMSLGMVAIRNFHLDFGLGLPLSGKPLTLHAGAGSKASPIEAKIGIFGGSFFVVLDLDFHQTDVDWRVEAGVSAFMEIGFDAIVVSAAVRLRIAMSFVFNKTAGGNTTKFTGSVSLEGEIGLLGLVEVSAAIVGTVTYNSGTEKAIMKGTIHWAVDTPLGGPDGTLKLGQTEIDLGDSGPGPTRAPHHVAAAVTIPPTVGFGTLYAPSDWSDYSAAFA